MDDETPCRVCSCTDSKPCPGGCYWVEPDLCSKCAGHDTGRAQKAAA